MTIGVYELKVDQQGFATLWKALGDLPAMQARGLMNSFEQQVVAQEADWKAPAKDASDAAPAP